MCSLGYFQELREGLLVYSACSDPFCIHQDKCITNLPSHEGLPLIAIIFHGLHTAVFSHGGTALLVPLSESECECIQLSNVNPETIISLLPNWTDT